MKAAGLLIACSILCVGCAASRGRAVPEDTGWLTYSGDYSGKRYSDQASIHAGNVRHLRPEWVRQLDGPGKKFEATPLVRDGVMYLSEGPSRVSALNVVTGRPLWIFDRPLPVGTRTMYSVNRGVALLGTRLYWGTLDAHLIALNATTGHLVWDVEAAENSRGYSITAAPLAIDGRIIVGYSGGEMNLPGFLDAFDPESGRRLWRQPTIPAEGEPARKTWPARSPVSPGGAPTWMTGTYDPVSDLLFWGTGNPGIDFNGRHREGENLYSNCLLAVEPKTGMIRWSFQTTPHDLHDFDANGIPILSELDLGGRRRKVVLQANKNGFLYVLDRESGEFLAGHPFTELNWTEGLDARGKPRPLAEATPTPRGATVFPGSLGATNWWSPTLDAESGRIFIPVNETGEEFFSRDALPPPIPGAILFGGGARSLDRLETQGSVRALDPASGQVAWTFPIPEGTAGGLLSTAGRLLFGSTAAGYFFALDSRDGRPLWRFPTGGFINAAPITYSYRGRQHVSVASQGALFDFALPESP